MTCHHISKTKRHTVTSVKQIQLCDICFAQGSAISDDWLFAWVDCLNGLQTLSILLLIKKSSIDMKSYKSSNFLILYLILLRNKKSRGKNVAGINCHDRNLTTFAAFSSNDSLLSDLRRYLHPLLLTFLKKRFYFSFFSPKKCYNESFLHFQFTIFVILVFFVFLYFPEL